MSNLSILDLIKVYIGFMKASTFILVFSEEGNFLVEWPAFILNGDDKYLQVPANRVPRFHG
ncbi:hypothetical protein CHCC20375_2516 [Bacillus licheniformis]|nr:hypothetical protein CHCC20375_2516 [Bacillus licheniformis]